jgi:hypothetical protein
MGMLHSQDVIESNRSSMGMTPHHMLFWGTGWVGDIVRPIQRGASFEERREGKGNNILEDTSRR